MIRPLARIARIFLKRGTSYTIYIAARGSLKPGAARETLDAAWEEKLARLAAYKVEHGDCNVSQSWSEDPPLATWVSNQRRRKKRLDRGELSEGMTSAARAAKLETLGFAC
jgi:hypothetical protein